MLIKEVHIKQFKRFHDLTITGLQEENRLVVLAGPNGSGKSSLFEAFNVFHRIHFRGMSLDPDYYLKKGNSFGEPANNVEIEFFDGGMTGTQTRIARAFNIRSAYRNEADFQLVHLQRVGPVEDGPNIERLIDNDMKVSHNYLRLVSETLSGVYDGTHDDKSVPELREFLIGALRLSMKRVFGDLVVGGTGRPLEGGTFLFEKGQSKDFKYMNLSAGEKAAFDLLLDLLIKRDLYNDTVYCIDEPETHIGTRVQKALLEEIVNLLPSRSQLWIATHSIGMMRAARNLQEQKHGEVVFLDFTDRDFDQQVTIQPAQINRQFWSSVLDVALDDLATLVAPQLIVLCEGEERVQGTQHMPGFDADCYSKIFSGEFPDVAFLSVGSSKDVQSDRLGLGKAVELLIRGTEVRRLVDRDDQSPEEINELPGDVRVLRRRHLEAYLLDDEVLTKLCQKADQEGKAEEILATKRKELADSVTRGNPHDDLKSASRSIIAALRRILHFTASGSTTHIFMRNVLAPLVTPDTRVYQELRADIFSTPRQTFTDELISAAESRIITPLSIPLR